ncbi:MAG: glucose-6-phosphate isomerase [Bradymonadales bacterium]
MKELWKRYKEYFCAVDSIGLGLDISRMNFSDDFFEKHEKQIQAAFDAMEKLEMGSIANPDENRMVGHYWLRNAALAPSDDLREEISKTIDAILAFKVKVHSQALRSPSGKAFTQLLVIGIGGSALGPQWVSNALSRAHDDAMVLHFMDNTDPEGIEATLHRIGDLRDETLIVVISKSGSTPETRNAMLYTQNDFEQRGLNFAKQAVAITGRGSSLDKTAKDGGWLARFPMWDWVGGRTSELCAVGLLPAALQGIDIVEMLRGAADCDVVTRHRDTKQNPAALMALMWFYASRGKGERDFVVLPYKDKLLLFSRYLQQLIMESLGKEKDLDGKIVHQGLSVYGNKGSTDQHAYVQQLREGVNNFFICFIECMQDGGREIEVERDVNVGDYLHGFLQGTRQALHDNGRESMTLSIPRVDAYYIGVLIALFERAVGLYASLININAYHQPGVEAGKAAAASILELQIKIIDALKTTNEELSAEQLASKIKHEDDVEMIYKILCRLAANGRAKQSSDKLGDFSKRFWKL